MNVTRMRAANAAKLNAMWSRTPDEPEPWACPDCGGVGQRYVVERGGGRYTMSYHVACETCEGTGVRRED